MRDLQDGMTGLRRPRLLVSAARFGLPDYRRGPMLRRLIGAAPGPTLALSRLFEEEALLDEARREGAAEYDLRRHVEVLIAILGETRLAEAAEMRKDGAAPEICGIGS